MTDYDDFKDSEKEVKILLQTVDVNYWPSSGNPQSQTFLTNSLGEVAILKWEIMVETERLNWKMQEDNTNSFLEELNSGFLWPLGTVSNTSVGSEMRNEDGDSDLLLNRYVQL